LCHSELSEVDREFENWSGQTKDYIIGILCFSDKHASLKSETKDCGIGMMIVSVSYHNKNPTRRVLHHIVLEYDMFPAMI